MNRELISKALMALEHADSWTDDLTVHYEVAEAIEALRQELEKPEPEPIAYLAWRDGKPCWDGDDCVCQDEVYPVDFDDDRTSMPVYLKGNQNV